MKATVRFVTTTVAMSVLAAVGCSTQSRAPDDTASKSASSAPPSSAPSSSGTSDSASATSKIAQLEADARALAKTTGCNSATECRTAPVGERACGGPRDYIVYCAATTDSVALFKKLDELKAAEIEFNKSSNAMSTCEFRMPPKTASIGGRCRPAGAP
jgi:hypothetical protein